MSEGSPPSQLVPAEFDDLSRTPAAGETDWSADARNDPGSNTVAQEFDAVYDVPVKVHAVLGRSRMEIGELMRLKAGDVVELDRRVGEPVDMFVNNRLIARGEVVLIDNALGVTLTEIVRQDR